MGKKIWKGLIITFMVLTIILLAVGIGLLVLSSMNPPSEKWIGQDNKPLTVVQFDGSAIYVTGALLLAISFVLLAFLIINWIIRKRLIKDIKEELESGELKVNLDKYGFLLAHVFPYSKKEKEALKGVVK